MNHLLKIILLTGILFVSQCQLNAQPSITWQRTYGNSGIQYGYSIVQTPDGGYIAAGRRFHNIYVLGLNSNGDTLWTREFPGYQATSIIKTLDNNYVIAGTYSDVVKININGEILWSGNFGFRVSDIKEDTDSSLIICGLFENGSNRIPVLLKLLSNGSSIFQKQYFINSLDAYFSSIVINDIGEYVICGQVSDTSFISKQFFLLKTDQNGNEISQIRYDTLKFFQPQSMIITSDKGYLAGGYKVGHSVIAKFESNGSFQWTKTFDSLSYSECKSITATNDNGVVFTGTWDSVNSTFYLRLHKLDSNYNEEWRRSFGFNDNDAGYNIRQTSDSGLIIIGIRDNFNNGDIYIVKTDKNGYANPPVSISNNSEILPDQFELYQNYPNPFNPNTIISYQISMINVVKLKVYDVLGKEVATLVNQKQSAGRYSVEFNGQNLSSGIYFYKLEAGEFVETKRMVLLK